MVTKNTEVTNLQSLYEQSGNQLIVFYGKEGSQKSTLLKEFTKDKKCFYYYATEAALEEQVMLMGNAVGNQFDVKLQKNTYEEYFNRIKTGDPTKLVVVIDEFQNIMKKDPAFLTAIIKLKMKRLYPGPVMILLCTSSVVWVEQSMKEQFAEDYKRIDQIIKISDLNFLEVVRAFPMYSVSESIRIYGVLGGVPAYLNAWDTQKNFRDNICQLVLSENGALYHEADRRIRAELRELSVYNTILSAIAAGHNKLNDLYLKTGFSRAKISVYMKNLSEFDIVEKVVSFETGGWDNAKKGIYQIKDTFIHFYYRFIYPHQSELFWMEPMDFYDRFIEPELDDYLNRYFRNVCMEYLYLLNQVGQLPLQITKMGTWLGKIGTIDIVAQNSVRENLVGLCNWNRPMLTNEMCDELFRAMKKAKITSNHIYLFSAKAFDPVLEERAKTDQRFTLIDMNEL